MRKPLTLWERVRNGFLKKFGDIKVYRFPFFMLYDPGSYLIKGEEIREVLDTIQDGDILIRGYKNYLDGYFIPGFFSHSGLYIGETKRDQSPAQLAAEQAKHYKDGKQMVIHSMAEGVFMEDVINFCRCDYLVILRSPFAQDPNNYHQVHQTALKRLGTPYDFQFDFSRYNNMSCTEFVYSCYPEAVLNEHGIRVKNGKFLGLVERQMLLPDDFIESDLELVWSSAQVPAEVLNHLRD